jgi:regulator of protease activity HflC (stomatin/prohibitin superfamily)
MLPVAITAAVVLLLVVVLGVRIVPQQTAHIVERLGRFNGVLGPGLNVIIPFID